MRVTSISGNVILNCTVPKSALAMGEVRALPVDDGRVIYRERDFLLDIESNARLQIRL